jgi:hypothetical protein
MYTVNEKTAITLVGLGVVVILVCVPLLFGWIKMNCAYGFRFGKAFETEENWYKVNRYGAKMLIYWALALMAVGIWCLHIPAESVLTVSKAGFISIIIPLGFTLRYSRRL